jgi:hypothetical protein
MRFKLWGHTVSERLLQVCRWQYEPVLFTWHKSICSRSIWGSHGSGYENIYLLGQKGRVARCKSIEVSEEHFAMEAMCSLETSVECRRTAQRCIPEDRTVQYLLSMLSVEPMGKVKTEDNLKTSFTLLQNGLWHASMYTVTYELSGACSSHEQNTQCIKHFVRQISGEGNTWETERHMGIKYQIVKTYFDIIWQSELLTQIRPAHDRVHWRDLVNLGFCRSK